MKPLPSRRTIRERQFMTEKDLKQIEGLNPWGDKIVNTVRALIPFVEYTAAKITIATCNQKDCECHVIEKAKSFLKKFKGK